MNPLVTAVIPVYNRSWELRRALASLATQTRHDFEAIVCDDGSTEDVRAVVAEFEPRFALKYVRIDNSGGPARPRNTAAALADGEWLSFLDSDDWWDDNRLEHICPHLTDDVDFLYHRLRVVTAPTIRGRRERRTVIGEPLRDEPLTHMALFGNPIPNSAALVRRSVFARIGGMCEDRGLVALEDFDAWLRLVEDGVRPVYLDEVLGNYWIGEDGISAITEHHVARQEMLFARHVERMPVALRGRAEARQHYVLGSMLLRVPGRARDARAHLLRANNLSPGLARVKRLAKLCMTFRP